MEKEQILHRWEEYIGELYDDQRPEIASKEQAEGPSILEQEVIKALKHMKAGKAPGQTESRLKCLKPWDLLAH